MWRRLPEALAAIAITATGLSLLRSKRSWVRIWDFPRLQVALVGTAALAALLGSEAERDRPAPPSGSTLDPSRVPDPFARRAITGLLAAATAYQWVHVGRYTPLAPREVEDATPDGGESRLSILEANVLMSNRDSARLLALIREWAPDVAVCAETDTWWCERLESLAEDYPYRVKVPLDNTYGMMMLSRLPLFDIRIERLVDPDVPSIRAHVRLRSGATVLVHCVHPRPPAPDKNPDSRERDAELLQVARQVRGAGVPVVVCGDLNDVAWSRTTRLFQKISGLVDPRKGRGFYSTFSAFVPGFRFPLDHCFHSSDFRLVDLRVLPAIGSDHFPMYVELLHEPAARESTHAPQADRDDWQEAHRTIREGSG